MTAIKVYNSIDLNVNNKINKSSFKRPKRTLDDYKEQVSKAIDKIGGRYVKFEDINHTEGLMVAGVIIDSELEKINDKDKVHFAIMNRDKKIVYINNNEHFNVLQDIPASLYILDYLYAHEPNTLRDYAESAFETDNAKVFTKICIRNMNNKQKKTNKNNKK